MFSSVSASVTVHTLESAGFNEKLVIITNTRFKLQMKVLVLGMRIYGHH